MRRVDLLIFIASLFLAAGFCFTATEDTFAVDENDVVLEVYYDETLLADYSKASLQQIANQQEGAKTYNFSAMNTHPSPALAEGVTGPTVAGILEDALTRGAGEGVPEGLQEVAGEQLIDIRESGDSTSYHALYTKDQLLGERYYYPNVMNEENRNGAPPLSSSYEGKVPVPAILSLTETTEPKRAGRFLIGQITPHEQNQPEWVQGMITNASRKGRIIIRSDRAEQWNAIASIGQDAEGRIPVGEVTINRDVNVFQPNGGNRYWIYYTIDGSDPTRDSAIYNCNNNEFGESYEVINKPVFETEGPVTIRTKVFGSGKLDSKPTTFNVVVKDKNEEIIPTLSAPAIRGIKAGQETVTLQWKTVTGAIGYQICRTTNLKGNYPVVKTINTGKTLFWKNTGLPGGTRYYYKVRAFTKTESGKTVYSPFSKSVYAKPAVKKPYIKAIKVKKKTITLSWSPLTRVSGYQIARATKAKGKYKVVKTITNKKTASWKNSKLKKGKTYYYKIRAYRVVSGKKVYSSYSAVKYKKVK